MIRTAIILFLVAALATAMLAITGEPGHASVVWLGWRADMTAAAFVLITLFVALSAMLAWRLLVWAAEAPRRAERTAWWSACSRSCSRRCFSTASGSAS